MKTAEQLREQYRLSPKAFEAELNRAEDVAIYILRRIYETRRNAYCKQTFKDAERLGDVADRLDRASDILDMMNSLWTASRGEY